MTTTTKVIAWEREETDACERGTQGCSISHSDSSEDVGCETW
jgi:hypothetical protein